MGATAGLHRVRTGRTGRTPRAPERQIVVAAVVLVTGLVLHGGHDAMTGFHGAVEGAALMAAMMLPLAALSVRVVAERSFAWRRSRAAAEHAAGFAGVWFAYGLAAMAAAAAIRQVLSPVPAFAALAAAAWAWQRSDTRAGIAERCGRIRSGPPSGWRAEVSTFVGGADQAARCVRTCWVSMLAMAAAPHVVLMAVVLAANLSEWVPGRNPFARRRRRRPLPVYAALAIGATTAAAIL